MPNIIYEYYVSQNVFVLHGFYKKLNQPYREVTTSMQYFSTLDELKRYVESNNLILVKGK